MDKCKNMLHTCGNNFLKWKSSPRTVICFFMLVVFLYSMTAGVRALTAAQNMAVTPWLFPFILSYSMNLCVLYFTLILLFCDAPFFDEQFPYLCMRTGRLVWVVGQILYIIFASLLFTVVNYILSLLACLPNLGFSLGWGKILRIMTMPTSGDFLKLYMTGVMADPAGSANVMSLYTPIQATLLSLLLMWLVGIFLGLLMFAINLRAHQGIGALAASFFVFFDFFASIFADGHGFTTPVIYYFSPVSWTNLTKLQMNVNDRPPLSYALTVLCVVIILLILVCIHTMKKREIEVLPEI